MGQMSSTTSETKICSSKNMFSCSSFMILQIQANVAETPDVAAYLQRLGVASCCSKNTLAASPQHRPGSKTYWSSE